MEYENNDKVRILNSSTEIDKISANISDLHNAFSLLQSEIDKQTPHIDSLENIIITERNYVKEAESELTSANESSDKYRTRKVYIYSTIGAISGLLLPVAPITGIIGGFCVGAIYGVL